MTSLSMKDSMTRLVRENSIENSHSSLSLAFAVFSKYGMAPLCCIYLGYVLQLKDQVIEKRASEMVAIVKEQTQINAKMTEALVGIKDLVSQSNQKLIEIERKRNP